MSMPKRYKTTTPAAVRACVDADMSVNRAAEVLGVSPSMLRHACSLFGWSTKGRAGCVPNKRNLPTPRGAHDPFGVTSA